MERRWGRLTRSVAHYRTRAEQLRAAALYASDDLTHDTLMYLAKQYDKMAEAREAQLAQAEVLSPSAAHTTRP